VRNSRWLFLALFAALLASRLCHINILWEGDSYPLAAAGQMAQGKMLYRDIWFDKPPVLPALYLLWGARDGAPLRIADALYALLLCAVAYGFARDYWSEREGAWAAGLCGFFLIFDFPSSAIPLASDLLMVAPHIAAVWMAWKRRPLISGVLAGLAFWINPKGLLVAAVCAAWDPPGIARMAAGFAAVSAAALAWLGVNGAVAAWWEQVWIWGRIYASSTFLESPVWNGVIRTLGWIAFHAAAVLAAAWFVRKEWRSGVRPWLWWTLVALAGVSAGMRFFPRYYFLLLPVVVLMAARGVSLMPRRWAMVASMLLAIPLVRFAPSYVTAARGVPWRDTAMDRDSRTAAGQVRRLANPGDTLLVWGYRPEIYVYSGLPAATRYIDTQALTGVPADRHLTDSRPIETGQPAERRRALTHSSPSLIVDGLGLYNPQLAIGRYPELAGWLSQYREAARADGTVIYQRK